MKFKIKLMQFKVVGYIWRIEVDIAQKLYEHCDKLFNKHGELFAYLYDNVKGEINESRN